MASINIPAMQSLISALTTALAGLPGDQRGLSGALSGVDLDTSPTSPLTDVIGWTQDELPTLTRRLSMAQAIEAQSPGALSTVSFPESVISTVPASQAQAQGAAAAQALVGHTGPPSATLLAEIARNQNDPYFAAGFATNATPAQLAQVVLSMSRTRDTLANTVAPSTYLTALATWKTDYTTLLSGVGTTIATATRSTGRLALPGAYAGQWTDTITAAPPAAGGQAPSGLGAAASLLLTAGSFSTRFLDQVSSGVYDYERQHAGSGPLWQPRSTVGDTYEGPYRPDGSSASDPLANIVTALSHNPQAAQDFFDVANPNAKLTTVSINGQSVPVDDRLKYLIEDRTWATTLGSDDGTGLGAALNAATTFFRDQSANGVVSATIAAQTFALVGSYTGHGYSDGGLFGLGSHQGWKMSTGMRAGVATMVASYSPDLIRVTGVATPAAVEFDGRWTVSDPDNSLFPPNGPPSAWMDPSLMKNLLGTIGEDPKNLDVVNAGIGASGRLMLSYAAQRGLVTDPNAAAEVISGGRSVPALTGASSALAYALSFSITAGYHGDKNNQAFQTQRAEDISKILGIVASVPALELPEGHAWTGFLIDTVKDQALDQIGEGPAGDPQGTYNDTSADYQGQLQQMALNALLANGYFSAANYQKANPVDAPNDYVSPFDPKYAGQTPPAVSIGGDGQPHFNYASQAYRDWVQAGQGLTTWLQSNVVGPFRANLPAYGS